MDNYNSISRTNEVLKMLFKEDSFCLQRTPIVSRIQWSRFNTLLVHLYVDNCQIYIKQ